MTSQSSYDGKAPEPESSRLYAKRVENYTPDNILARLSLNNSSGLINSQARKTHLASDANRLLAVIELKNSDNDVNFSGR